MATVVMFVLNDIRRDARVLREAMTLTAAGHQVTVVGRPSAADDPTPERELRDGVSLLRIPVPGAGRRALLEAGAGRSARTGGGAKNQGRRSRSLLSRAISLIGRSRRMPLIGSVIDGLDLLVRWRFGTIAWGVAAAAAAPKADVWHAHDLSGLPAAIRAHARHGGRLVYDAHELFTEAGDTATRPRWAKAVLRRYERQAIGQADAVIAVNGGLATELRRIAEPRRLIVVHNAPAAPATAGHAHLLAARSPLRAAVGVTRDTPLALYHGSFAADRGVDVLAAALREPGMDGVHAVFLGEGAQGRALDAAASDPAYGGRLHVLAPVAPLEVTAWVAGADVGVMPIAPTTRNHRLSTPNKLFECLAAGVPVVASDFPGIRRIVAADPDSMLGVLVDPTDPGAVARGILSIIGAPNAEREALRERCLQAALTKWNWETESRALVALYDELVEAAPAAASAAEPEGDPSGPPMPQRVTFVLPSTGEFDSRTRRMAISLGARGHDVLVIARAAPSLPDREELAPGVVLVRVESGGPRPTAPGGSRGRLRQLMDDSRRIAATARAARRQAVAAQRVDRPASIYHAMGFLALPVAIELARRAGSPFVYDARDLYVAGNNIARLPAPLRAVFARRERSWARRAAAVLTVNVSLADELERRLGVPRPTVVLNAQESWTPPAMAPDLIREALRLPARCRLVLYHGGFMRDRGIPELIAALQEPGLDEVHLALMGSGPIESELRDLAASPTVAGRVHLLPPVPPPELLAWVASADVGAMVNQPRTLNERLSTPNKLFECLAAGTPVVSSDFPERRRIIIEDPDGPLGALCDPTDPASIAGALRSILDLDADARADLRGRCRRAASLRYDWAAQMDRLIALYGRVTGSPW